MRVVTKHDNSSTFQQVVSLFPNLTVAVLKTGCGHVAESETWSNGEF